MLAVGNGDLELDLVDADGAEVLDLVRASVGVVELDAGSWWPLWLWSQPIGVCAVVH